MVQKFKKIPLHGFQGIVGIEFILHPLEDPFEFRFGAFIHAVNKREDPVNNSPLSLSSRLSSSTGGKGKWIGSGG